MAGLINHTFYGWPLQGSFGTKIHLIQEKTAFRETCNPLIGAFINVLQPHMEILILYRQVHLQKSCGLMKI
jgi:hypothetical protein